MSNLDKILALMGQINGLLPIVDTIARAIWALFADATPDLTNAQRIALLRSRGIAVVGDADTWLAAHPPTTPPGTDDGAAADC